jgi:hypothetical protein
MQNHATRKSQITDTTQPEPDSIVHCWEGFYLCRTRNGNMRRILKLPTPKQAAIFFLLVAAFLDPAIYAAQGLTADSAILLTSSTSSLRFHSSLPPRQKRTDRPARVHRSYCDRFRDDDDVQGDRLVPNDEISRRLSTDRPTLSRTEVVGPPIVPSKPKIVVLGASGKVGRLVVQQLLESNVDMTVVAFVRDYDKVRLMPAKVCERGPTPTVRVVRVEYLRMSYRILLTWIRTMFSTVTLGMSCIV